MAITIKRIRDVKNGSTYRTWRSPKGGYTFYAGYDGTNGDYWVTQIEFTSDAPFSGLALTLYAETENTDSSHQLRWGISSSATEQANNRANNQVGTVCGTNIRFSNGTWYAHTFNSTGSFAYPSGTYYLSIWNSTAGYGDYCELLDYSNYPMGLASTATPPLRTITYNANGGTGTMANTTYYYATTGTTNLRKNTFTRSGYSFLGWSLSSTATTPSYTDGQAWSLSNNSNYTLYAVWSQSVITYTITYNANGGTGAPSNQTKSSNADLILSSSVPTREGYIFMGWSTSPDGNLMYSAGGVYFQNVATTLYAVWKKANNEQIGFVRVGTKQGYAYIQTQGIYKNAIPYVYLNGWKVCE